MAHGMSTVTDTGIFGNPDSWVRPLPQTYAEALRALADEVERKEQALAEAKKLAEERDTALKSRGLAESGGR